jgi:hypothetical protein
MGVDHQHVVIVGRRTPMPVSLKDILGAFEFVSAGGMGEHQAFLCKESGKISTTAKNTFKYLIKENSI